MTHRNQRKTRNPANAAGKFVERELNDSAHPGIRTAATAHTECVDWVRSGDGLCIHYDPVLAVQNLTRK